MLEQFRIDGREAGSIKIVSVESVLHIGEQLHFLGRGRIEDADFGQKAIELRLGQRVRAFEVDRVLRGKNSEERGKRMGRAVNRYLALLHALQQRSLGSWRHAIDFIDQQQLGEYGTLMKLERAGTHIENVGADDVGRHEIGSTLHALKFQAQKMRERFDGERLGDSRHAFEQRVSAAQERDQTLGLEVVLSDDNFPHFVAYVAHERLYCFHSAFSLN